MSVLIYWLSIRAYILLARIAAMFNPKAKLFVQGRAGLLKKIHYALIDEQRERIWVHCASLGEFEQGRPIIEKLKHEYPNHAVVLTFFSPSGYEVKKDYEGVDYVFYLPFDSSRNAKKFIDLVQPVLAVFVKYEYWYFYINRLAKENISTILISAIFRKEQVFFKWYGILHRKMLRLFSHIFVQDDASANMLNRIDLVDVTIAGDTRFDRVFETSRNTAPINHIERYCADAKVLVAGSTWSDDEQLLSDTFSKLPDNWKLILAPHEVHDAHISQLKNIFKDAVLWTEYTDEFANKRVLIINTIGLLSKLYQYADIAYVGGGFNKSGIHNILEAATFGKPIAHGPNYDKFKEAKDLLAVGSSFVCNRDKDLLQKIELYKDNPDSYETACRQSRGYVERNVGATKTIMSYIQDKLRSTKL